MYTPKQQSLAARGALICVLALGLCQCALGQTLPTTDAVLKARFVGDAPKGWSRYTADAARMQGTTALIASKSLGAQLQKVVELKVEFKQARDCALFGMDYVLTGGKADGRSELSVFNPEYRFRLERRGASLPWVMTEVSRDLIKETAPGREWLSPLYQLRGPVFAPIVINGNLSEDWPTILSSPNFKLKSVRKENNENELITVEFEMDWLPTQQNLVSVKSGQVTFDPERNWVMRRYECKLQQFRGAKNPPALIGQSRVLEYVGAAGESPLPARVATRQFGSDGKLLAEEVVDYQVVLADLPRSAFTLSAFGFPEPFGKVSFYLWALIVALLCAGLAITLRYWKLRSKSQ